MSLATDARPRVGADSPPSASRAEITDPRIDAILGHVRGDTLDVGCVQHDAAKRTDSNWLHQHLYREADRVLGVDLDSEGVETLRDAGYRVAVANAERLDVPGGWETVVAGELIEHLSCPGAFLDAARRVVSADGQLVLTTPNPWCFARLKHLRTPGGVPCNEEHTCYIDEPNLRELLARHGWSVSDIEWIGPRCRGVTDALYRLGGRWRRLGATQYLCVAEVSD